MLKFLMFVFHQGSTRTSSMQAPIMLLTGHEAEIFSAKFSPDGEMVVSGGFDRLICKLYLSSQGSFCQCVQPMRDNISTHYFVMSSLIGLMHAQNDPCLAIQNLFILFSIWKTKWKDIQWNLYNETGKVLLKRHKFHHLPATVFTISCFFSLSWETLVLRYHIM